MAIARRQLINTDATPYYHIVNRCVRRAFLCGQDALTKQDFSHRRQWIEDKIIALSKVFAIDVAAYAIMSNHYHLVLHIDVKQAKEWSTREVFEQYGQLFQHGVMAQQFLDDASLTQAQLHAVTGLAEKYRERLMSISWFMRSLNQHIARKANIEDNVTGRFWEGRFKSQALLDEIAVLTCMAYVDLNPIRAKTASTPESSDFTSIQTRLGKNLRQSSTINKLLLPFNKPNAEYGDKGIPMKQAAYFELVDWTGRCIRDDKRGAIPLHIPPILDRLNMTQQEWLRNSQFFEARFKRVAGTWEHIKKAAIIFNKKWMQGKPLKPNTSPS